jgi:hypothetical protein
MVSIVLGIVHLGLSNSEDEFLEECGDRLFLGAGRSIRCMCLLLAA